MREPYEKNQAAKLARLAVKAGNYSVSDHGRKEMAKDSMRLGDMLNVLRVGRVLEEPEEENGSYRYRMHTPNMCVVIAFRSHDKIVVVTAWRKKQ